MSTLGKTKRAKRAAYASSKSRWEAVLARDPEADGKFYYSVRTTGVYCVPSCRSRLALRENVAFHDSAAECEAAGFRACKRCWPNGPTLAEEHAAAVARACQVLESCEQTPSLEILARAAGMSAFHFHRTFKAITGVTPKMYATARRSQRLREELQGRGTITQAIYNAGFSSSGRFYAQATDALGMTPTEFRRGGAGMKIRFAAGECSLGSVLVAVSELGVCALSLGDDPDVLLREFQDRFSKADLIGGDEQFEQMVSQIIGFIEKPEIGLALPLDVRGTAFQQRVWQALREIPAGTTVNYTQLAERIGAPKAVRAVASACAANTVAVAIPCHRVVRRNGVLSGYRWGIERKAALLEREARA